MLEYLVIDVFWAVPDRKIVGRVVSRHHTAEAAHKARKRLKGGTRFSVVRDATGAAANGAPFQVDEPVHTGDYEAILEGY